jgi:hypothetical protein
MRGRADQLGRRRNAGRGLEALTVMAEASCWRYSRVPAGQPRIMQPSYTVGKAVSPVGGRMVPGGNEKPTFVDAERDASLSENADGVSGNEIGYTSIDKEAGIIN